MWVFWQRAFAWISCHFYMKIWHWFGSLVSVDCACASWVRHCKLPSKNGLNLIQHFLLLLVANWHRLLGRIRCLDWLVFMASFLLPLFVCGVAPRVLCNPFFTSWTQSCAKNLMWQWQPVQGKPSLNIVHHHKNVFHQCFMTRKDENKKHFKKKMGGGISIHRHSQVRLILVNVLYASCWC